MIAFTAIKGIFFLGSFCAIFWLKKRSLMPGLCLSNKLISQDKGLHCNFACLLYSMLVNRLPRLQIVEIVSSAVKIKMEFVIDALPVKLIGMNSLMMCNYINFARIDSSSPLDVNVTTKQGIRSNGWRLLA
jgi:ribonucleotide reductase beta subunit family protein with ferritin-like domain